MSGGPYQVNFGSKLGQVQSPFQGIQPAAAYMHAPPNPAWAWANWKPAGTAAIEGLKSGLQEGAALKELPSDLAMKEAQVEQVKTETQAQQNQANIAALTAGVNLTPPYSRKQGQSFNVPLPFPDLWSKGSTKVGLPQDQGGGGSGGGSGGGGTTQQTTQGTQGTQPTTQGGPAQTTASPMAEGSGTYQQPTASNGQVVTPQSGAQAPNPPAGGVPAAMMLANTAQRNNWVANNPGKDLSESGLLTPSLQTGIDPSKLPVGLDGRIPVGTAPSGEIIYYDNGPRKDTYFVEPLAGGKEQRYYSRPATPEERMNGITEDDPQRMQEINMQKYLTDQKYIPEKHGFPAGTQVADLHGNDLLNASEHAQITAARRPLPDGETDNLERRSNLLDVGQNVENALNEMRDKNGNLDPSQYNVIKTTLANAGGKYATVPIAGDILKTLNGGQGPTKAQSDFFQAYNSFLQQARYSTTENTRSNPHEWDALQESIGNPTENNWDFANRFGNNLQQLRHNYVNRVDIDLANGYKFHEIGPNDEILKHNPLLDQADAMRPFVRQYAQSVTPTQTIQGVGTGNQTQGTAQQGPINIGPKTDLGGIKGTPIVNINIGGRPSKLQLTPEVRQKLQQWQATQ